MSLYDSVKSLLRICQFCGISPFYVGKKNKLTWQERPLSKILPLVHVIFSGLIFLIVLLWPNFFLNQSDYKLRQVLFFLLLIGNHIPVMIAPLELYIKWDKQVEFWNIFGKLDYLLNYHLNQQINHRHLKNGIYRVIVAYFCECFFLIFFGVIIKLQTNQTYKTSYMCIFYPFYILSRIISE